MVTAELAACLPVLVLVLAAAISAVAVAGAKVRADDAVREAVRATARGDPGQGRRLASLAAPGASITLSSPGDTVIASARLRVRLLASWLPSVTVTARAVAAREPGTAAAATRNPP